MRAAGGGERSISARLAEYPQGGLLPRGKLIYTLQWRPAVAGRAAERGRTDVAFAALVSVRGEVGVATGREARAKSEELVGPRTDANVCPLRHFNNQRQVTRGAGQILFLSESTQGG